MKKYISIFKMSLYESFQFLNTIFFRFISFFVNMFLLISVWNYIYDEPSKLISGYSFSMMIWYLLFSEVITYTKSEKVKNEIQRDIQTGSIAYKINKPYGYILYYFSRYLGDCLIRFISYSIVSILIGIIFIKEFMISFNILELFLIIITILLSVVINGLIMIAITLLAFRFEDSDPFHWIYKKLALIFGVFFPIEMFPLLIQKIITYSPIFVTIYGPVKLLISFDISLFKNVLLFQIIYLILLIIIIKIMYKKGAKKLNVNGG